MEDKKEEMVQNFKFNDRLKTFNVITTKKTDKCSSVYTDEFSEKQVKELHENLVKEKNSLEKTIQSLEKDIESRNQVIDSSKIKLDDSQKKLKEDLIILQQYKPIDDAVVMKKRSEDLMANLKKDIKKVKENIEKIQNKCKGVKFK